MVRKLEITKEKKREDHAKVKRTEWHVHSNFSEMDGVCAIEELSLIHIYEYLAACYWNSMALAYDYMRKNDMESINIAFPCISTGINAYPNHEACVCLLYTSII